MARVLDVVRTTVTFDDLDALSSCLGGISSDPAVSILRVKNRYSPEFDSADGYRDVSLLVVGPELTQGMVCEVQLNLERMYRAMNQEVPVQKRTLELNPDHPVIDIMLSLKDQGDERLDDFCCLLYDQALLTEGSQIEDPLRFAELVTDLMVKSG